MILKFDSVPGHNLVALLSFIHGDENRVTIPNREGQLMIVRIKAVNPDNQEGGTWYSLTLDILERLPKGDKPGQNRVDSKYFLRVCEILLENQFHMTFVELKHGDRFVVTEVYLSRTGATGMKDMVFQKDGDAHAKIVRGPMAGEARHFKPEVEVEMVG